MRRTAPLPACLSLRLARPSPASAPPRTLVRLLDGPVEKAAGLAPEAAPRVAVDLEAPGEELQIPRLDGQVYAAVRTGSEQRGLSELEYTLTLTDTRTGAVRTDHNPAGTCCGGLDDDAF